MHFKRAIWSRGDQRTTGFQNYSPTIPILTPIYSFHKFQKFDLHAIEKSSRRRQDFWTRRSSEIRSRNRWDSGRSSSKKPVPECCSQHNGYSQSKTRSYADKSYGCSMAACEACKASESRCAPTNYLVQLSGLLISAHAQLPAQGVAINVRAGGASNTNSPPIAKSLPVR